MSFTHLIPAITGVLTAPGVDLTQISAKSVRKSILAADTQLDPEWVRSNKQGIDDLIAQIFNTVSASQQADAQSQGQTKRKREDDSDAAAGSSSVPQSRPTSTSQNHAVKKESRSEPPQTKQEVDDEEYARRISAELNASARGRTTRGGSIHTNGNATSSSSKKRKVGGSRSSKVKSPSKIVDSDMSGSEGYDDDDGDASDGGAASKRKPAKRKRAQGEGGGAKGGFGKEFILSEPLSAVCGGVTHLSRPQVVKALWVYIKGNQLQNPRNKRQILCDEKLSVVFKAARIDMFTMNKELGAHLYDPNDAS